MSKKLEYRDSSKETMQGSLRLYAPLVVGYFLLKKSKEKSTTSKTTFKVLGLASFGFALLTWSVMYRGGFMGNRMSASRQNRMITFGLSETFPLPKRTKDDRVANEDADILASAPQN